MVLLVAGYLLFMQFQLLVAIVVGRAIGTTTFDIIASLLVNWIEYPVVRLFIQSKAELIIVIEIVPSLTVIPFTFHRFATMLVQDCLLHQS